jgi:hypothetical protein
VSSVLPTGESALSSTTKIANKTNPMDGYDYFKSQFKNVLRNTTAEISNLHVATAGGWAVYNVWQEDEKGNSEVYFAGSDNGGISYREPMNLSNNPGNSTEPEVGTYGDGSNVFVAWTDTTPGNSDIFLRSSTDAGRTFGEVENISDDVNESIHPQLVVDTTGKVVLSWVSISSSGESTVESDCRRC